MQAVRGSALEKIIYIFRGPEYLSKSESYSWIWLGDNYWAQELTASAKLKKNAVSGMNI